MEVYIIGKRVAFLHEIDASTKTKFGHFIEQKKWAISISDKNRKFLCEFYPIFGVLFFS